MAAYVGIDTTLQFKLTSGASYASMGRVQSAELTPEQSLEHLDGATAESSAIYSMIQPRGSASLWVQSVAIFGYLQRTVLNGLPPTIAAIEGGVIGDSISKHETCWLNSCELSLEKGGALQANIEWVALIHTVGSVTTSATALAKNLILAWHTAAVSFAGSAYNCQSIRVRLDNGLTLDTDLDAKEAGYERQPTVCKPGLQAVTAEVEFAAKPDLTVFATSPPTVQIVYSARNSEGTPKTFLHTVSNLHPVGLPIPVTRGADEVVYRVSLEADHMDLLAWSTPTLS